MKIINSIEEISRELDLLRNANKSIGFVPTMGTLHDGHLSLLQRSVKENDASIVSIFVNPTQFNNKEDFQLYPRNLEDDYKILDSYDCSLVFAPLESEIYPEKDTRIFNLKPLDEIMEGASRPGHFNGVAQIVTKLFDIVMPNKAYFGMKDFQQLAIIKKIVADLNYPVEIISCPIIREKNGLAMSSRNKRLSEIEKKHAALIYKVLVETKKMTNEKSVSEIKNWVINQINNDPYLRVEYFEIVEDTNLKSVKNWEEPSNKIGCIAVYAGKIRLIDNVNYNYL